MNRIKYLPFAVFVIAAILISGCQQPPLKVNSIIENNTAGRSVQGRSIPCYSFGAGREVVMIIATIHGDENAGTPLTYRLIEYLRNNPEHIRSRTIVILPVANPDGLAANTRFNSEGIDLNRNFSSGNRQNNAVNGLRPLSEPEAVFIKSAIDHYRPDRIISFHEPLACIDYDGDGERLAEHLSGHCNLPVKKLGTRPGSLGAYAGHTLGIPIITLEMTEADSHAGDNTLWHRYGDLLLAFIDYPGEL